jgi:integrase
VAQIKMNHLKLESLAVPGDYFDAAFSGLHITVGPKRKTWRYMVRPQGKAQRIKLGYFPEMSIDAARKAAEKVDERLNAGLPAVEPTAAPVLHPRSPAGLLTLGGLVDKYEQRMREKHPDGGARSLSENLRVVRNNLGEHLNLPARSFTKADLIKIRDDIAEGRGPGRKVPGKPALVTSRRFLAYLGPIMRFGAREDLIAASFVPDVDRRGKEITRKRVLTDDEIRRIWKACGTLNTPLKRSFGHLVRFLLITAARKSEGAEMTYDELKLGGLWILPAERAKNGTECAVVLPKLALDQIPEGGQGFVYPGQRGTPMGGYSKLLAGLHKASGTSGWTLHDLRRTVTTRLQRAGMAPHIVDAVLNHSVGGGSAAQQVSSAYKHYAHSPMVEAKTEALELWAAELSRILAADRPALTVVG